MLEKNPVQDRESTVVGGRKGAGLGVGMKGACLERVNFRQTSE